MNHRMKILILLLLAGVLILSAAVAHRAFGSTDPGTPPENSGAETPAGSGSVTLFVENGLWGARSAGGRVLLEPSWYHLRTMQDDLLIARKQTGNGSIRSGIIRTDGSVLVPFLYSSIEPKNDILWLASLEERGSTRYHLYRSDGTRWSDTEWDGCELNGDELLLTAGSDTVAYRLTDGKPVRTAWNSTHEVGLHSLTMQFDAAQLANMPDTGTLLALGNAAAAYLIYLFIDDRYVDSSLFSGSGDPASVAVSARYRGCRLISAEVSGVTVQETAGYPAYQLQIPVQYRRTEASGSSMVVRTALTLTVSRNAAGAYTYSGFRDASPGLAGLNR